MAQIFLCHAGEDKPQVREMYQWLMSLGFAPWFDEVDILPGQDWKYEIEKAFETSDFVMVFLSERSVQKPGYVQHEFQRALELSQDMPEGYIHTIPVKLDDCTVPRRFRRYQWVNLYEEGANDRIVRALSHGLSQRGERPPSLSMEDYRALVENVHDVLYIVDKGGIITYISPSVEDHSGYKPLEVMGESFLSFVYEEDKDRVFQKFQEALHGQLEPTDFRIVAKSGEHRLIQSYSNPLEENGEVVGLRGIFISIA